MDAFPEDFEDGYRRAISLDEYMRTKVQNVSSLDRTKSTCYILVSHGHFVDSLAHMQDLEIQLKPQYSDEEKEAILEELYGVSY